MRLTKCDQCELTKEESEVLGWLLLKRDGDTAYWNFCSVACLAEWSAAAV